jgi:carboxymethylenebutenolidase
MKDHPQADASPAPSADLSRRDFVALSVAGGLVAAGAPTSAAPALVERDVVVKTPDGSCDAAFIHPASGAHAGVLLWPDAFGLRPAMRDMARRLAAEGYAVLVPNPFYRVGKAPMFESAATFSFNDPAERAKLQPLMASIGATGAAEKDAVACVAFLDAQAAVDKTKKVGTQGYCMGGPLVLRTAAAVPGRVGAGGSFHGGGLVTSKPDSPHLLAPQIKATMYFAVAANDDQRQPEAKQEIRDAFAAAKVPAEVEVYPAQHGWCVPDMPKDNGVPLYDMAQAERAWSKLLVLYRTALA